MKVGSLLKIIDRVRDLYCGAGDTLHARALENLKRMLEPHHNKPLSTVLNALTSAAKIARLQQSSVEASADRVRVARTGLQAVESIFAAGKASTVSRSFGALDDALAPFDGCSIRVVSSFLASSLRGGRRKQLDRDTVNGYLAVLRGAVDAGRFIQTVDQLRKDPTASILETNAIAEQFTGQKKDYRSKPAALTAIEKAFLANLRVDNKLKAHE